MRASTLCEVRVHYFLGCIRELLLSKLQVFGKKKKLLASLVWQPAQRKFNTNRLKFDISKDVQNYLLFIHYVMESRNRTFPIC